jgi:hypothetical protein
MATRKKQPTTGRDALIEEFNKLKNPNPAPLAKLKESENQKARPKPPSRKPDSGKLGLLFLDLSLLSCSWLI